MRRRLNRACRASGKLPWDVALQEGAAISHHHGIGLARRPYVRRALGSGYLVLERIKAALDPASILNPGKLGLPNPYEHVWS